MKNSNKKLKFIDLFSGLGGFHVAMRDFNGECVLACDIDEKVNSVYKENFGIQPFLDIKDIDAKLIPEHDILFAGFPCQPFSKGGAQKGFDDIRGTLFFEIVRILNEKKPKYVLLENVSNLVSHDQGRTYKIILRTLVSLGYSVPQKPIILSPHLFGIPVLRPRVYIPCILNQKGAGKKLSFHFEKDFSSEPLSIYSMIDAKRVPKEFYISEYEKRILQMWNDFYQGIKMKVIGFPIWAETFKSKTSIDNLPKWKQNFILKNRKLYAENKKHIDEWFVKYENLSWCNPSHRKFEWQAGDSIDNIYEGLIQFRPSGVRVKRPDKFSTLVAMNHPQIIGKYLRRLTPDETKKLQSFPSNYKLDPNNNLALKQLGNSVNVYVVKKVISKLLEIN